MDKKLLISAIGLPEKERNVLTVTARLLSAFGITVEIAEAGTDGDIAVIDPTSDAGKQHLLNPPAHQARLVISEQDGVTEGRRHLKRPVLVQTLRDALVEIIENFEASGGSAADAKTVTEEKAKAKAAPSPVVQPVAAVAMSDTKGSLLKACSGAVLGKQMLEVKTEGLPAFYIHGPSRYVYTQAADDAIEAFAAARREVNWTRLVEQDFVKATANIKGRPLADIYWPLMMAGGQGEALPAEMQNQALKLKAWPRIKTAYAQNEHLILLLQLSKHPMTAQAAAKAAGVSQTLANDVFMAVHVMDIGVAAAPVEAAAPAAESAKPKGLFGKIMQHLARKSA